MKTTERSVKEDRFVPLQEGCRRLGISTRTAHRKRGTAELPPMFVIGGRLKFRVNDIDRFIAGGGKIDD